LNRKRLKILISISAAIILVAAAVSIYLVNFMPNSNTADYFKGRETSLIVEGQLIEDERAALVSDGEVLIAVTVIKEYFDPYIWWDEAERKVTVTTADRVIRMQTESLNAIINDEPVELNMPVTLEMGIVYIPIDFLKELYGISIRYAETTGCVIIDYVDSIVRVAEQLEDELIIRLDRSVRAPVIKTLGEKERSLGEAELRVYEEYDKWYRVRAYDGSMGYVEKSDVVVTIRRFSYIRHHKPKGLSWEPEEGMISLGWETGDKKDLYGSNEKIRGLDVISPLWFDFEEKTLKLKNGANARSLDWAQRNGYQVWPMLKNDNLLPSRSSAFLNSSALREALIRELLVYCALYRFDGINIDLENINLTDKDALTQFVRELTPYIREQGLVVSMCVGVPDGSNNYSKCYDLKALGESVDYIMLMTYDQHWKGSPEAGSVAQYPWVEQKLKRTLEFVPREKLFLGLPLYNRLWKEVTEDDGKITVTNAAVINMETAKQQLAANNSTPVWDDTSGQYYAEYSKGGALYKLWLEDENSINLKSSLAQKYRLAGTAAWRMNFETPLVWEVLYNNLKVYKTYEAWQDANPGGQAVPKYY